MFPDLTRDDVFRIETPRLWLRWPALSDVPALARVAGEKEVAEMTANWPHPLLVEDVQRRIFEMRKLNALGCGLALVLSPRGRPGDAIGLVRGRFDAACFNFGYMLDIDHWGEGLMTEAVQAVIDAVFTLTDAEEARAGVRVINAPSRRVLEKAGFQMVSTGLDDCPARGGREPCDRFRLGRTTWSALKGWRTPSFNRISIDAGINALDAAIAARALEAAHVRRGA